MKRVKVLVHGKYETCQEIVSQGYKEKCEVVFSDGSKLKCSTDHKFVIDGEEVEALDLETGSEVKILVGAYALASSYKTVKGLKIDEEVAHALGFFAGDGFAYRDIRSNGKDFGWQYGLTVKPGYEKVS